MNKLFVGNLDYTVTSDDIKQAFAPFGTIVDAVVIMDKMTGRSRGFGFVEFGKPNAEGFNLAANGGYDFVNGALQYAGVQAVYNWNCCGLTVGYRRFSLGSIRDETQYLYSFTLANFGSVGDIRRSNSIFRDPTLPPAY